MTEEKKYDNSKTMFLQADEKGQKYGSGEWEDGVKLYIKNIRKVDAYQVGDVSTPTPEVYTNKNGDVRFKHRTCGILKYNQSDALLILELYEGQKEQFTCSPKIITSKKTNKEMLMFDFSGRNYGEPNPYEKDLESAPF